MTNLSPKARRFIELAMAEVEDPKVTATWRAIDHDVGGPLPNAAARAALTALQHFEHRLHLRLEGAVGEDDAADLSNDLGLVTAIEDDLRKQLKRAA